MYKTICLIMFGYVCVFTTQEQYPLSEGIPDTSVIVKQEEVKPKPASKTEVEKEFETKLKFLYHSLVEIKKDIKDIKKDIAELKKTSTATEEEIPVDERASVLEDGPKTNRHIQLVVQLLEATAETERFKNQISRLEQQLSEATAHEIPEIPVDKRVENNTQIFSPDEINSRVYLLFKDKCSECHSKQNGKQIALLGEDGFGKYLVDLNLNQRKNLYDVVASYENDLLARGKKPMPLDKPVLVEQELTLIKKWVSLKGNYKR